MNETQALGALVAALWAVLLGVVAAVWSMLRKRIENLEMATQTLLVASARQQERSDGHDRSYESLQETIQRIENKLDRALGIRSPFPRNGE